MSVTNVHLDGLLMSLEQLKSVFLRQNQKFKLVKSKLSVNVSTQPFRILKLTKKIKTIVMLSTQ